MSLRGIKTRVGPEILVYDLHNLANSFQIEEIWFTQP
jgi:hypothetical protein